MVVAVTVTVPLILKVPEIGVAEATLPMATNTVVAHRNRFHRITCFLRSRLWKPAESQAKPLRILPEKFIKVNVQYCY
jgi:hypothetical protein